MSSLNDSEDRLRRRFDNRGRPLAVIRAFVGQSEDVTEVSVETVHAAIASTGNHLLRREITAVMRELEEEGLGKLISGRRGRQTRFVTSAGVARVGRLVLGEPIEAATGPQAARPNTIDHRFLLRHNCEASLLLPNDLTASDAKRLAQFILLLPQEDGATKESHALVQGRPESRSRLRPPCGEIHKSGATSVETIDNEQRLRLGVALDFRFPAGEIEVPRADLEGDLRTEVFIETASRDRNPTELIISRIDPYVEGCSVGRLRFLDANGKQVRVRRSPRKDASSPRRRLLAEAITHLHRYLQHHHANRKLGNLLSKVSISSIATLQIAPRTVDEALG